MIRQHSETVLEYHLFNALHSHLAPTQPILKEGATDFDFACRAGQGHCKRQGMLPYSLPSGFSLSHTSDILISLPVDAYLSLELKFLSAVTDQFKARSYDMVHLKNTHGRRLVGVMVYVHSPGVGISINRAREICYPFDHFVGLNSKDMQSQNFWKPVTEVVHCGLSGLGA